MSASSASAPAGWAGAGTAAGWPTRRTGALPGQVAELAESLADTCAGVVDVDELVALIESTGVNDRVAQQRYQQPSVFRLGEAVFTYLRLHRPALPRGRTPDEPREPFLRSATGRCALYLTPVVLVAAAGGPVERVGWAVAAGGLVAGWAGGQTLSHLGQVVMANRGRGPAARLLAAGFAALAAGCVALLAAAPERLVGADRPLAYGVCLAQLALFGSVAVTLVTGAVPAVLRWSVPAWLVAGAVLTGRWPAEAPVEPAVALAAGIALITGRAFWPALARARPVGPARPGIGRADLGRALLFGIIGLGQAAAFVLVWRTSPELGWIALPPATVPLLVGVPITEILIAWHVSRASAGLDAYDNRHEHRRHVHRLGALSLAALLPSLTGGLLLAASADRLPYRLYAYPQLNHLVLYTYPDVRDLVLALASGLLLSGVFAAILLLTARRRLVAAAMLALCPTALAAALAGGPARAATPESTAAAPDWGSHAWSQFTGVVGGWDQLLPGTVIALILVHLVALALAAFAVLDPRSYR